MTKINEDGSYAECPEPGTIMFEEDCVENVCEYIKAGTPLVSTWIAISGDKALPLDPYYIDERGCVRVLSFDGMAKMYATEEAAIKAGVAAEREYITDMMEKITTVEEKITTVEDYLAGLKP